MGETNLFEKKASSTLDFGVDWATWLAGDSLSSHVWVVPAGIIEVSRDFDDNIAVIFLSGGTPGETYELSSKIESTLGRDECTPIYIKIPDFDC